MKEFSAKNPREAIFWDQRFEQEFTPWSRIAVPQELINYVAGLKPAQACLIPGCGDGPEIAYFSQLGWQLEAIDFSAVAVARAKKALPAWADFIKEADFFHYQAPFPFDFIYERAFLCALPADLRLAVVDAWCRLLPTGGRLMGFFFVQEDVSAPSTKPGPPFTISQAALDALLSPYFICEQNIAAMDSPDVFQGKERWQVWRKFI